MNDKQVRNGIDILQSNAKRLFDDAEKLQKGKRYSTSIALYVFAYEEFNKAKYLCYKLLKGEQVDDAEFDKLTKSSKAHTRKILIDPLAFGEILEYSPEKFADRKKHSEQVGLPFVMVTQSYALKLHKGTMIIFGKLHDLKMAMLYADHDKSEWRSAKRFGERTLRDICEYLHFEIIRVYHNNRLNLFQFKHHISADMTNLDDKQRLLMIENQDRKALADLHRYHASARFVHCYLTTKSVLANL